MQMQLFFFIFAIFFHLALSAEQIKADVKAESAILINAKTGKVLFQKNASKRHFPASLTKIATAILAIDEGTHLLDQKFVATSEALCCISPQERRRDNYQKHPPYRLESDMSHAGIKHGEEMHFRDLLYGLMLCSAGDAANIIAENFGNGSIPQFMDTMNRFLRSIGCTHTYFCNPSGLHHPDHMTTAKDMAILCQYAMKNELFREVVRTTSYERMATNKQPATVYVQRNKLLMRGPFYYPHAVGIKTGWHSHALHNVAAAAEKDGRVLIAVLLHAKDRKEMFREAKMLFEKAFSQKKMEKTLLPTGAQSFSKNLQGAKNTLLTYTKEACTVSYYPAEEPHFRCQLVWDKLQLPVERGQKVGEIHLLCDNEVVKRVPLFSQNRVEHTLFALLVIKAKNILVNPWTYGVCGLLIVLFLSLLELKKKKKSGAK